MSVLIIKPVEHKCNLDCRYCYYCKDVNRNKIQTMSFGVLNILIKKSIEYFTKPYFVWHGGEPLMAGVDFFKKIIKLQSRYNSDKKIKNSVQSNATLINEEWVSLFHQNSFSVGISCDGPEKYHDFCRIYRNGRGSFSDVRRGIDFLKEKQLITSAISVINKISVNHPEEMCEFFYQQGFSDWLPKACYEFDDNKLTDFSITSNEYAEFLIKCFEWWVRKDDPNFNIRNLKQMSLSMLGGKSNLCEFTGRCSQFVTINTNGDVGPCDSLPSNEISFGNIVENSWDEILQGKPFREFYKKIQASKDACDKCEWSFVCKGGCLRYSYNDDMENWSTNAFCEARKKVFSHASKRIHEIV